MKENGLETTESAGLQLFRFLKWQAALSLVEAAKALITGTAGPANDLGCDAIAGLAARAAALEPVFPANGPVLRDDRDLVVRVHAQLRQQGVPSPARYDIRAVLQGDALPASPSALER